MAFRSSTRSSHPSRRVAFGASPLGVQRPVHNPEVRGRGFSAALLEEARRFAAQTGAKVLTLGMFVYNLLAQRLYERKD